MIEKNREIYSIGTICRLKNGKKYIMITGFFPLAKNEESKQEQVNRNEKDYEPYQFEEEELEEDDYYYEDDNEK